jgi:hypothetical protein
MHGGRHWAPISPDLTRDDSIPPPNLDATTAADDDHLTTNRGVIYTIAPSPLDEKFLWIGTDDGLVWQTTDSGDHWVNITPPALTPWSKIGGIEPSHCDANAAYIAVDRHRLEDDAPYIYRTTDRGQHWIRIDDGIARDAFVNVVREDPSCSGLLYAGTERGMFVSFNSGGEWQPLQQNLPMTSVRDIDLHGDDIVIATHGRGFWIMDDASALRQMNTARADEILLFKPAEAIRFRTANFTGTPFPKDEPMAANPPEGAAIDYALPSGIKGPVTLTIYDINNNEVRRFTDGDKHSIPDSSKHEYAAEWEKPKPALTATPGMHRFLWDLHNAAPPALQIDAHDFDGIWVLPGIYIVELIAGGKTVTQRLDVKPDPRVSLPVSAMQREFDLAARVVDAWSQAASALAQAKQLLKIVQQRKDPDSAQLATTLLDLSGASEDSENRPVKPPRRIDSLKTLEADLQNLEHAVDGADADPSPDAQAAYLHLSQMLTKTLGEWRLLKDSVREQHS